MPDIATLGLTIDAVGAIRAADATTTSLKTLADVGEETKIVLKGVVPPTIVPPQAPKQVDGLTASLKRMQQASLEASRTSQANAMASMIKASDPFQKQAESLANATKAAEGHRLAIGRINLALEGLATEALGANAKVGSLSAKFLEFGVGGVMTAGVLAGLAAIAIAWDKITEKSREAQKANEDALKRLEELAKKQRQGPFGDTPDDLAKTWAQLLDLTKKIRDLRATDGQTRIDPSGSHGTPIDNTQKIKETIALQGKLLDAVTAGGRDVANVTDDLNDKEWADWQRLQAQKIESMKATEDTLTRILREAAEQRARITEMESPGLGIRPDHGITGAMATAATANAMRNPQIGQSIFDSLAKFGADAQAKLTEALRNLKIIADVTADEATKTALKSIALNSVLGIASQIGGGTGLVGSIVQGGISGAAGGPWGIAIGAVSALASNILSLGKSAKVSAAEIAAMKTSVDNYLVGVDAANGSAAAQLQLQINQATADAQAARDTLAQAYPDRKVYAGNGNYHDYGRGDEYQKELDAINKKEKERVTYLQQQAEQIERASKIQGLTDTISSLTSLIDGLKGFRNSISLSDLSPLSPTQQLAEAKRQYDEIVTKARAGDQAAAGQLPDYARQLLEIARNGYSVSGAGYQQIYNQVLRDNDEVTKLFEDQRSIAQLQLDILTGVKDVLIDIRRGSAGAAGTAHQDAQDIRNAIAGDSGSDDDPTVHWDEL